jgi:hypothetical protein
MHLQQAIPYSTSAPNTDSVSSCLMLQLARRCAKSSVLAVCSLTPNTLQLVSGKLSEHRMAAKLTCKVAVGLSAGHYRRFCNADAGPC